MFYITYNVLKLLLCVYFSHALAFFGLNDFEVVFFFLLPKVIFIHLENNR